MKIDWNGWLTLLITEGLRKIGFFHRIKIRHMDIILLTSLKIDSELTIKQKKKLSLQNET